MSAASKIWTRTSLQSTHKVSCMNPSLQILHSPSTVYVLFLFCEIPSKLLIPQFGEKNTLSSSLHQQPPIYAALMLSFSQNKTSYSIRNNLFGASAPFQLCLPKKNILISKHLLTKCNQDIRKCKYSTSLKQF
jgi:hypothetical protein